MNDTITYFEILTAAYFYKQINIKIILILLKQVYFIDLMLL